MSSEICSYVATDAVRGAQGYKVWEFAVEPTLTEEGRWQVHIIAGEGRYSCIFRGWFADPTEHGYPPPGEYREYRLVPVERFDRQGRRHLPEDPLGYRAAEAGISGGPSGVSRLLRG